MLKDPIAKRDYTRDCTYEVVDLDLEQIKYLKKGTHPICRSENCMDRKCSKYYHKISNKKEKKRG
jgi:hypothetical protein